MNQSEDDDHPGQEETRGSNLCFVMYVVIECCHGDNRLPRR